MQMAYMQAMESSRYSIKEGSQSNAVITNLEMMNGGPDDQENFDKKDDPVQRSENITVSRDIKAKSYTIVHKYDINFGNNLIWSLIILHMQTIQIIKTLMPDLL